jgi:hypothetical protein
MGPVGARRWGFCAVGWLVEGWMELRRSVVVVVAGLLAVRFGSGVRGKVYRIREIRDARWCC